MPTRKIKDAVDLSTGEKVYYKGHAKATYLSDGRNVEDAINAGGSSANTTIVNHGTSDTTFELTPNTIHKWDVVSSLTLTLPEDEEGKANQYKVVFCADSDTFTLSLPDTLVWAGMAAPTFEALTVYELNIEDGRIAYDTFEYTGGGAS